MTKNLFERQGIRVILRVLVLGLSLLPGLAQASSNVSSSSTSNSNPFGIESDSDARPGPHGSVVWVSSRSSRDGTLFSQTPPFQQVGTQSASGYGSAAATEGTLFAFASAGSRTSGAIQNASNTNGSARAQWSDQLAIAAAGLTGQTGTLVATIELVGLFGANVGGSGPNDFPRGESHFRILGTGLPPANTSQLPPLLAGYCAGWAQCGRAVFDHQISFSATNLAGSTIALSIPIQFGAPVPLGYTLDVFAGTMCSSFVGGGGTNASALSDYGVGLRWGGISAILDANGAPIPEYVATSTSGFDYRSAAVPEPSGTLLLGAGLLWLIALGARLR